MKPNELPLFPLSSVLFPGGRLDLKIFERRYLDLVRDCAREGSCFGVCLILKGAEVGQPAIPAAIGTAARIEDFSTTEDGLLGIAVRGTQRFHVEHVRIRDSGLIVADVTWLPEDEPQSVPSEFGLLSTILQRAAERIEGELATIEKSKFDDAAFTAWRLSELLPLSPHDRLRILQLPNARERLTQLAHWLPRFQRD